MSSMINMKATAQAVRVFTPEHVAEETADSLNKVEWLNRHHPAWLPKTQLGGRELAPKNSDGVLSKEAEAMIYEIEVCGRRTNAVLKGIGLVHCAAIPVRE